jgi:hypothetical protein
MCIKHFLERSLKVALYEEPKHVAVKNDLIIFQLQLLNKKLCYTVQLHIFYRLLNITGSLT